MKRRLSPLITATVTSGFFLLAIAFIAYHLLFARKVIPGVWVGNLKLGGKTPASAYQLLEQTWGDASSKRGVIFTLPDGKEQVIPLDQLGVNLQLKETIEDAYKAGRAGNILADSRIKVIALWRGVHLLPKYSLEEDIFIGKLKEIFISQEQEFREARLTISPAGEIVYQAGKEGRVLRLAEMEQCLRQQIEQAKTSQWQCPVLTEIKRPQYTEDDLEQARTQLERIKTLTIKVSWEEGETTIQGAELANLLAMDETGLAVSLEAVTAYAKKLASLANYPAKNASFAVQPGGRLAQFTPAKEGRELNQEQFTEQLSSLLDKILSQQAIAQEAIVVRAPTATVAPVITSVDNQYGIKELLGEGRSFYHGSSANRIYNLKLASQRLNGRLIAPGETVSFNKLLGEVSAQTGYKSSYVIIGNQTVLGAGGGVCQTSTTLFRATLNAGLPILERTAHLYRVHYYEPPLGIDATVMAPYTDFVFQNDTPAYLLLQTAVNEEKEELTYQLFGTSDGRETVISAPAITNQTGYPAPIYREDPNLPAGKTIQVEWASAGATVVVTRKVTRGEETLQEDTFVSNYKPWPSVFLVGAGKEE